MQTTFNIFLSLITTDGQVYLVCLQMDNFRSFLRQHIDKRQISVFKNRPRIPFPFETVIYTSVYIYMYINVCVCIYIYKLYI
jgi:hypothetical protein